jgi:two-component system sensor histidine kinase HydH
LQTNGTVESVTLSPPSGRLFFRLKKQRRQFQHPLRLGTRLEAAVYLVENDEAMNLLEYICALEDDRFDLIYPPEIRELSDRHYEALFTKGSGFVSPYLAFFVSRMEKILATALGQDVSKLAAQEKQLLLSRLLARLAHEIRNPLSSLDIHVQLLEEDLAQAPSQVREKAAGRFEIIHGELHRLENIVIHFLSLAGPSSLDLQEVEVAKVVHHVCELLRPEAAARGIEIVMKVTEPVPPLTADPVQLTQALVNLVINGIQAVEGSGRVEVSVHTDAENELLAIEIYDTGPGIPLEKQSAIFEPFFTTKAEGSGLGLWIVQQIITAHGGTVFVANALDSGAVFTVHLPLRMKEAVHG